MKPGEQPGQGVGYLEDGTMVVVDDARDRVGTTLSVTVTSTLQTAAGRLVFARMNSADESTSSGDERGKPAANASAPAGNAGEAGANPDAGPPQNEPPQGAQDAGPLFRRGTSPRNPRR